MKVERYSRYLISVKLLIVCVALMVLLGTIAVWHINEVMKINLKYTEDTLDQLYEIRLEIDDLRRDIEEVKEIHGNMFYLTDADRDLIERIVSAEARGESYQGQMAVAQVIRDRAELWGKSVSEVCLAPSQFANPYQGEISESVKEAVRSVFDGGERVFSEPVTHFHADWVNPNWDKVNRGIIGRHKFYGD